MTPLVSILIPAHNAAAWIAETIASASSQTWPRVEVIVVEAGSTDDTAAVARSAATPRVRVISRGEPASAASNRNRALRDAQGEFIQFLDADDLLGADKIEIQMARLIDAPAMVASAEWARFVTSPADSRFVPAATWHDLAPDEWLVRDWTGGGGMMQPGLWLLPRAVLMRAGGWDERLTLIDDFEYFTRALLACEGVRFCAGARLYYRSGQPGRLSSLRSPEAWESAWLALTLGTQALLARRSDDEARRACADLFQQLAFEAHGDAPEIAARAEARVAELGGSDVVMGGGRLFDSLRRALGWKTAKRIKRTAYRLGYERIAAARRGASRRGRASRP